MNLSIPIILQEHGGIARDDEPVTMGIPLPRGLLKDTDKMILLDPDKGILPLQTQSLAHWQDGSVKWILLDFQAGIPADGTKELLLENQQTAGSGNPSSPILLDEQATELVIDTGAARFHVNTKIFQPFSRVVSDGRNRLSEQGSSVVLTDREGRENRATVSSWEWEAKGSLRATVKLTGIFPSEKETEQLSFIARLSFFAGLASCKIDLTLWNPRAAEHPGGLWDLGDPGSIYFNDFSLHLFPPPATTESIEYLVEKKGAFGQAGKEALQIYQDSSGGENWQSKNHVNCNNEVTTSFRGYRVTIADNMVMQGLRAAPCVCLQGENSRISVGVRHFWQNFPKALEADPDKITVRFFPNLFADLFELQGGERKTHTCLVDFSAKDLVKTSGWLHAPLEARTTPKWYADSRAIPYLVPADRNREKTLQELIQPAIEGGNTFFDRREIIDEYGWRNFGDWYADHEAVGYKGPAPLVAHYNNQYDGIRGTLCRYLQEGDYRWCLLGDQLCRHVRDIDIYHTDRDKPEFNKGLFWHTEHYLPAETATHRCFSRKHSGARDLNCYGGGPAMSHNYAAGLLYHYYLTGETASKEAVLDLAEYIHNAIRSRTTLTYFLVELARKTRTVLKGLLKGRAMVDFDKVYSMNGPGRGSGNSLSTLMTAYELTEDKKYLQTAKNVIQICIHPADDIDKMDMLDVENRWMYTVFLQALGKYLDLAREDNHAELWSYARDSLLLYAQWMLKNEYFYLEKPEKLEYPNETWAAQEIRKSNVFWLAAKYCDDEKMQKAFIEKAKFFWKECLKQLQAYDTHELTRPITILLQNCLVPSYFLYSSNRSLTPFEVTGKKDKKCFWNLLGRKRLLRQLYHIVRMFSLRNEIEFIRWRVK